MGIQIQLYMYVKKSHFFQHFISSQESLRRMGIIIFSFPSTIFHGNWGWSWSALTNAHLSPLIVSQGIKVERDWWPVSLHEFPILSFHNMCLKQWFSAWLIANNVHNILCNKWQLDLPDWVLVVSRYKSGQHFGCCTACLCCHGPFEIKIWQLRIPVEVNRTTVQMLLHRGRES